MEEYSRKRKRDNYTYDIIFERKRKIDYINIDINNKKRTYDNLDNILDDNVNNIIYNKKNKTYNCFIHDNLKEVCNIYQCSGVMCMNNNENIMYQYIK